MNHKTIGIFTMLLMLAAFPMGAQTVIAYDNSADMGQNGGTTSSLTLSSYSNGGSLLLVCLMGDTINGGKDDITGVTYANQALALINKYTTPNGSHNNNRMIYLYAIANPPTGTHSIVASAGSNHYLIGAAASYQNATLTNPLGATNTNGPVSTSPTTSSLTTIDPNSWIFMCDGGSNEAANGAGTTFRVKGANGVFNEPEIFDSNASFATPGSQSLSTTVANNVDHVDIMAELTAASVQSPPGLISFDTSLDGTNNFNGSGAWTFSYTNSGSLLLLCMEGDSIANGHDDLTAVTYNGTNMTLIDKYTTPDGSHTNNNIMYLYGLTSPSTGAHNINVTSTNNHNLSGVAESFFNAGGWQRAGHSGPSASSPYLTTQKTAAAGSWVVVCAQGDLAAASGALSTLRTHQAHFGHPALLDSNNFINPPRLGGLKFGDSFNTNLNDDIHISAEIRATTPLNGLYESGIFTNSASWTATGASTGLATCTYDLAAWDSTTFPFSNITSAITGDTCNSTSFNVNVTFAGNKTGFLTIVSPPVQ